MSSKLIIIRGPSGSGKSTVAKALFQQMPSRTMLVQQDHFRFILNPSGGGCEPNLSLIQEMIKHNTLHALKAGYDVILEGNLVRSQYSEVLDYIINNHDSDPSVFYFDIPLKETLNRHKSRESAERLTEDEMIAWYNLSTPLGYDGECFISQNQSVDSAIALIKGFGEI